MKRLLAVTRWDEDSFAVGDILIFSAYYNMLLDLGYYPTTELDVVVTRSGPLRKDVGCVDEMFHYYFMKMLPIFFVNDRLHNIYLVDNIDEFLEMNKDNYYIAFINYQQFLSGLRNESRSRGYIPRLSSNYATKLWTGQFIKKYVWPHNMLTIHLRNNTRQPWRNAEMDEWLKFSIYCQETHPEYKLVFVSEADEVDSRFRSLSNVVIAKDYGTTVEEDMALIQYATMFMGMACGPSTIAAFNDTPYMIYKYRTPYLEYGENWPWATPLQRVYWIDDGRESFNMLVNTFENLNDSINKEEWKETTQKLIEESDKLFFKKEGEVKIIGLGQ